MTMKLVLVAIAALWAAVSEAAVVVTHPYQGVTYTTRTETSPRAETMHIVQIDLTAPGISFRVTPSGGTQDTVRQTTLEFLNQQNAQVAINAHFFLPFPSTDTAANVVGLAASQGNVYSAFEPQPIAAGYADQSYAIVQYAPGLNIDAANHATIVHRDASFTDNKHVMEPVTLWNAVSGSAQIVSSGVKTIPTYSGLPSGLTPGGGYTDSNSWYAVANARTAIGLTQDRHTLVLFTVDKAGGSLGMTAGEVADMLIGDYRVYDALNLDGGGSTTLAMQDPATHLGSIVNVSSDNPLGRIVGSNLAIFAVPVPEPSTATLCFFVVGAGLAVVASRRWKGVLGFAAGRFCHVALWCGRPACPENACDGTGNDFNVDRTRRVRKLGTRRVPATVTVSSDPKRETA
jgi:hypothetical protein